MTEGTRTKVRIESRRIGTTSLTALLALSIFAAPLRAQDPGEEARPADQEAQAADLAKAAQNPIGNLISVPFQNNTSFQIGPFNRTSNVLNIQPVIPVELSGSILLINRVILPVVSSPDVTRPNGTTWGLGDLNYTAFFTPADAGPLMVGAGPVLLFPTGTSDDTGSGKWGPVHRSFSLRRPGTR
jgi:hypothetical protein